MQSVSTWLRFLAAWPAVKLAEVYGAMIDRHMAHNFGEAE